MLTGGPLITRKEPEKGKPTLEEYQRILSWLKKSNSGIKKRPIEETEEYDPEQIITDQELIEYRKMAKKYKSL